MRPQGEPPTDDAHLTAPVRGWAAYALVAAAAALLLAALVGLVPDRPGPYALYAASRFGTFVNVATVGFPVAAVYLAHLTPVLRGARLLTAVALAALAAAAVGGTIFGAMIGLYGLVSHGPGVGAGLQALLTWLAYLGLLVVAVQYCWRVWRGRYAGVPRGAAAAGGDRTAFLPGAAGPHPAEVPTMRTPVVRAAGGLYGQRQPHPPQPPAPTWQASLPLPEASPDVVAVLAGAHSVPPAADPGTDPAASRTGDSPTSGVPLTDAPPTVAAAPPADPPRPRATPADPVPAAVAAAPPPPSPPAPAAPSAPAAPWSSAAPAASPVPPVPRPGGAAVPAVTPSADPQRTQVLRSAGPPATRPGHPPQAEPGARAGDHPSGGDPREASPEAAEAASEATQLLAGPQGTQILPPVSTAGPETTHLLPPHER